MDINKLVTLLPDMAAFVTVVESESFSKAAQVLDMTPSGVSRQVSRLEKALQLTLLERTTRKQTLTIAGQETYNYCKSIVDNAQEVVNISDKSSNNIEGLLRVSTPKALGNQVLQPLFLQFLELYPNIKLKIKVTDQSCDPINDNLDVIFNLTNQPQENLIAKPLAKINLVLCATPIYLQTNGIPKHPSELDKHQCLSLGETQHDNEWEFQQGSEYYQIKVDGRFVVNHTEMRLDAVMHNLGIGIFPSFVVQEKLKKGLLLEVLSHWEVQGNYHGDIMMQFLRSKHMPNRLRVFIDFMDQQFETIRIKKES